MVSKEGVYPCYESRNQLVAVSCRTRLCCPELSWAGGARLCQAVLGYAKLWLFSACLRSCGSAPRHRSPCIGTGRRWIAMLKLGRSRGRLLFEGGGSVTPGTDPRLTKAPSSLRQLAGQAAAQKRAKR